MTELVGDRFDDRRVGVESCVREVVSTFRSEFAADESVVVVPDAVYPHHESTGLVANPAAVSAVCAELAPLVDDLFLLPAVGSTARSTVVDLLDYDAVAEGVGATLVAPLDTDTVTTTVTLDGPEGDDTVDVTLPRPLLDAAVVAVPTLRNSPGDVAAAGMRTLGLVAAEVGDETDERWRTAAATYPVAQPRLSVLDGSYVFAGRPHRGGFVAAGSDAVGVDRLGAWLLGFDPGDAPALSVHGWSGKYEYVRGLSADALADELPDDGPPPGDEPGLLERGYRLYARISGDLVPPQALPEESP